MGVATGVGVSPETVTVCEIGAGAACTGFFF
jgi:hypothetical protein